MMKRDMVQEKLQNLRSDINRVCIKSDDDDYSDDYTRFADYLHNQLGGISNTCLILMRNIKNSGIK